MSWSANVVTMTTQTTVSPGFTFVVLVADELSESSKVELSGCKAQSCIYRAVTCKYYL